MVSENIIKAASIDPRLPGWIKASARRGKPQFYYLRIDHAPHRLKRELGDPGSQLSF